MLKMQVRIADHFPGVLALTEKQAAVGVRRLAAYMMKVEKNSIKTPRIGKTKKSKKKAKEPSPPGKPPLSRTGALKNFIFWDWDPVRRSAVVGPAILPGKTKAQVPLEFGGPSLAVTGFKNNRRKITVNVRARPFVRPALEKTLLQVEMFFKDKIKR